jgi:methylglyoxal synthase
MGSHIAEDLIDFLIFFWDSLEPLLHEPDIKALLHLAAFGNIPRGMQSDVRGFPDFVAKDS